MKEVEKSRCKDVIERTSKTEGTRAVDIKIYDDDIALSFLIHTFSRSLIHVRFISNLPFLFDFGTICNAGVEVDLLQKRQINYCILAVGEVSETKLMYKEVVLVSDVWDLLDELMI